MDSQRVPIDETPWRTPLGPKVSYHYDAASDTLYLESGPTYRGQDSLMLDVEELIIRWNPSTGVVERIEVLFFSERKPGELDYLPVTPEVLASLPSLLQLAKAA